MMGETFTCPVCGSREGREFLRRTRVPVHQNLVIVSLEEALRATRGDLVLASCTDCGFVFNSAFDASLLAY